MIIDKANLSHVGIKDATRGLHDMQFGPDGTWTSDGRCAMFVAYPDIDPEECPSGGFDPTVGPQEFQARLADIKALDLAAKKPANWMGTPRWGIVLGGVTKDEIQVHSLTKDGKFDWSLARSNGSFPRMDRIVPTVDNPATCANFNVPLLKKLLTSLEKAGLARGIGKNDMHARIFFRKENQAVRVDMKGGIMGVIMPVTLANAKGPKVNFEVSHRSSESTEPEPQPYEGETVQVHGPGTGKEGQAKSVEDMNWRERLKAGVK
jgi:hypothetical protein